MFKLKYKFKKILRFLNKILRVILIFGCIASLLCFEASAAVYRDDDNFFEAFGNSEGFVYSSLYEEGYVCDRFQHAYTYSYKIPTQVRGLEYAYFNLDETVLDRIGEGNTIILKGELLIRNDLGTIGGSPDNFVRFLVDNSCPLTIMFWSQQKTFTIKGSIKPKLTYRPADERYYASYEFDINWTIPQNYDYYENFSLSFLFDFDNQGYGYYEDNMGRFYLGSDKLSLYVGDEDNAPLYPEYDSNIPENIEGKEEMAFDEAAAGLSEAGSFIGQFQNIFENGGPTVAGLMFVNMFMDDLSINVPWIRILLVISLSLGVITIILGVFNVVKRGR